MIMLLQGTSSRPGGDFFGKVMLIPELSLEFLSNKIAKEPLEIWWRFVGGCLDFDCGSRFWSCRNVGAIGFSRIEENRRRGTGFRCDLFGCKLSFPGSWTLGSLDVRTGGIFVGAFQLFRMGRTVRRKIYHKLPLLF
jgi:hypothetical protein